MATAWKCHPLDTLSHAHGLISEHELLSYWETNNGTVIKLISLFPRKTKTLSYQQSARNVTTMCSELSDLFHHNSIHRVKLLENIRAWPCLCATCPRGSPPRCNNTTYSSHFQDWSWWCHNDVTTMWYLMILVSNEDVTSPLFPFNGYRYQSPWVNPMSTIGCRYSRVWYSYSYSYSEGTYEIQPAGDLYQPMR